jgi:aminocarboxymuconate-semialdehyde decarboxylase
LPVTRPSEAERLPIIDVHAHVTPQRFQRAVLSGSNWFGMTPADGELGNVRNRWGPERRIEAMDADQVDIQLLSPTDCFYQYGREPAITARIAAECNDEVAVMVRDHPKRFMGLGTLPMQDPDRAVAEMERGLRQVGLRGFMIDDHVNGLTYDHELFAPFWAAAEALDAFIFVHQGAPTSVTYRTQKYFLLNTVGNLVDRTLTYGCLVYGGLMDKHPGLTVCLAHAGGYVPYAIDRMDQGWRMRPESRGQSRDLPSSYLHRFYYDTVTYTDRNLRLLIDTVGVDRVVFGTDWPAPMAVPEPVGRLRSSSVLTDDERRAILTDNTARIFGASARRPA